MNENPYESPQAAVGSGGKEAGPARRGRRILLKVVLAVLLLVLWPWSMNATAAHIWASMLHPAYQIGAFIWGLICCGCPVALIVLAVSCFRKPKSRETETKENEDKVGGGSQ
jgi:hypothetical protein